MLKILRVTHKYMYAMFGISFIFALGLEDELLEDVVIPYDDTADSAPLTKIRGEPNLERVFVLIVGNLFSSRHLAVRFDV
jgi:hypothetical protein